MTKPGEWKHGGSAYVNHKCRCSVCTEAHRVTMAKRKAERAAIVKESGLPSHIKHGRNAYGNWGCRCEVCTAAHTQYRAQLRAKERRQPPE